jgi:acetylornithine/succinyldiaminopimelate/putrescine aminotransferase
MTPDLSLAHLLGRTGPGIAGALEAAFRFLDAHAPAQLMTRVGQRIDEVPTCEPVDKSALPAAYGGNQAGASDDFLAGRGLFYVSEQRRLFLDCTSGHYQMLWGYQHPLLCSALAEAQRQGVIWDNHSNIPQAPLKQLARRLVSLANDPGWLEPLDKVLLGVCTGSVACAAALKIQLKVFATNHGGSLVPVVIALAGNYHGTDLVPQFMRGLWPHLARPCEFVQVQPNNVEELEAAFARQRGRVAGFWAEPVLMNREAIAVEAEYLRRARQLCDEAGALLCLDEIQTGFWRPEIFDCRALGVRPDLLVLGKGLAAGFHPLSGVLFHHRHDVLEQYDAISTNGSAALPALIALASLELIGAQAEAISATARRLEQGLRALVAEFPEPLEAAHGRGHLAGLKFRTVAAATAFHRRLLEAGLWTRVHAYHAGHRTLLTKLGLLADDTVLDFILTTFRRFLQDAAAAR